MTVRIAFHADAVLFSEEAFRAHIFFDDQEYHLDTASRFVPSARVPYKSDSPLFRKEDLLILSARKGKNLVYQFENDVKN